MKRRSFFSALAALIAAPKALLRASEHDSLSPTFDVPADVEPSDLDIMVWTAGTPQPTNYDHAHVAWRPLELVRDDGMFVTVWPDKRGFYQIPGGSYTHP